MLYKVYVTHSRTHSHTGFWPTIGSNLRLAQGHFGMLRGGGGDRTCDQQTARSTVPPEPQTAQHDQTTPQMLLSFNWCMEARGSPTHFKPVRRSMKQGPEINSQCDSRGGERGQNPQYEILFLCYRPFTAAPRGNRIPRSIKRTFNNKRTVLLEDNHFICLTQTAEASH